MTNWTQSEQFVLNPSPDGDILRIELNPERPWKQLYLYRDIAIGVGAFLLESELIFWNQGVPTGRFPVSLANDPGATLSTKSVVLFSVALDPNVNNSSPPADSIQVDLCRCISGGISRVRIAPQRIHCEGELATFGIRRMIGVQPTEMLIFVGIKESTEPL